MSSELRFDYTTVGHVTIDVLADGSRRPGGAAFYSALQAARLGLRTRIVTQGVAREIEQLLEPYRSEFEMEITPASQTTTLATFGEGGERSQQVLAWAGAMSAELVLDTTILHLAPVARETPADWRGSSDFLGLTPQGWLRNWKRDGMFSLAPPSARFEAVAARCDAVVLSVHEQPSCAALLELAARAGATIVITAGPSANTLMHSGSTLELTVPPVEAPRDDLGAGDVFAAALFVALSEGEGASAAANFANAAAAVRIQGVGAGAVGTRASILERLAGAGT